MKISFRIAIVIFVLSLAALACGAPAAFIERGDITIVNPADGTQFHDDDTGVGNSKVLSVTSTFETDKDATFYINNVGPYGCRLLANQTTTCGNILLQTGENVIRMSVPKGMATSEATVTVSWVPYAPMDKFMGGVAGIFSKDGSKFGNPVVGYGMVLMLIAICGTIAIGAVFGRFGAGNVGAVVGFFLTLILAAVYFNAAGNTILAGQVLTLIYSIIAVAFFSFIAYTMVNRGYMGSTGGWVSVRDGDREIRMGVGPQLGPGERVSTPEKMGDSAARMLAEMQGENSQQYLPSYDIPQLESGSRRKKGGALQRWFGRH